MSTGSREIPGRSLLIKGVHDNPCYVKSEDFKEAPQISPPNAADFQSWAGLSAATALLLARIAPSGIATATAQTPSN